MSLKYAVHPGMVRSKTDWQRHFIPSIALMKLYGVRPEECLVVSRADPSRVYEANRAKALRLSLIPLLPRYDGNYSLPSADCS